MPFTKGAECAGNLIQERLWRSCRGVVECTHRAEPPHSSTDHTCDPPEALSWKEIGLPTGILYSVSCPPFKLFSAVKVFPIR